MKVELNYEASDGFKFWKKTTYFWRIEVIDNRQIITFGPLGSVGSSTSKVFESNIGARSDAERQIGVNLAKGYTKISASDTENPIEKLPKIPINKSDIIRDDDTFAGKPIREFKTKLDIKSAVKLRSNSYEDDEPKVVDKLDLLIQQPNIHELDTLVIGEWQESYEEDCSAILNKLIEHKHKFSGLKHLFVGDMTGEECEISWINQTDYSNFYQHFPALETFGVKGGQDLTLGNINLPNLKSLIIETGGLAGSVVQGLAKSNLPNLEYLDVWLGTDEYGCTTTISDIQPILNNVFPNLKYLGLKNYDNQDDLAKALKNAAVLDQIDVLDISMGILKDEGAQALHENDALLNLKHINCRHHFISEEWQAKLWKKFFAQNINLDDGEAPEDDDWYYVEVGE